MSASGAILVLGFRHEDAPAPWHPLRLEEPPGLALLRHNLAAIRTELNPSAARLHRLAVDPPACAFALYDLDGAPAARAAGAALERAGIAVTPVRGGVADAACAGTTAARAPGAGGARRSSALLPLLIGAGAVPPPRWAHPVLRAWGLGARGAAVPLGLVFGRIPEPGVLGLDDVGRDGAREGAAPAALEQAVRPAELLPLVAALERAGTGGVLLVDNGGDVAALAAALAATGKLAAWFGVARRPAPPAVAAARVPLYVWLEPEDTDPPAVPDGRGCAFVPVALPGEDVPAATARLLELRRRGYATVVPRFFAPVPGTAEWHRLADAFSVRAARLDGAHVPFGLPAWRRAVGPELVALWTRDNRPPTGAPTPRAARRTFSLHALGTVLDGYLADRERDPPTHHARELVADVLGALPAHAEALTPIADYPFVGWRGESLLALVDQAIDRRLRALDGAPPPLLRAIQDAVLAGGKRIRPILVLVIAAAEGVPLATAMPAALAVEWLHGASLVQDDLPAMDDDRIRRHRAATHVRHGEGLALLAADALVALAFEDVAALASDPRVGAGRAAAMVAALARAIGVGGLVGGQARDLLARGAVPADAATVLAIHRRKTAPLFELAATLATVLAHVAAPRAAELVQLLGTMGVAFQIVDDVLDQTPDNPAFGRPAGSDARRRLPTFATLVGPLPARRHAADLLRAHLGPQRATAPAVARLARFILDRRS